MTAMVPLGGGGGGDVPDYDDDEEDDDDKLRTVLRRCLAIC
jgi:hypothetical protein